MLTSSQMESLTLRASSVHAHAAFPYFERSINRLSTEAHTFPKKSATAGEEPRLMRMPSYLNFYVRYRPASASSSANAGGKSGDDAEKGCKWSRVIRVRQLADVRREVEEHNNNNNNAGVLQEAAPGSGTAVRERPRPAPLSLGQQSATAPETSTGHRDTFEWRKRIFWVCLEVEGESEPVQLPQLSNKPPTADEVMAYCERHAADFPDQTFTDTPDVVDAVLTREIDRSDLRVYVPTNHQIHFLEAYWKKECAAHAWTDAELVEAKELNRRYLPRNAGAAAGPVSATLSHLGNLTLETNLGLASSQPYQRSNMRGSHAALREAMTTSRRAPRDAPSNNNNSSQGFLGLHSASSPLLWTQAGSQAAGASAFDDTQASGDPFIESATPMDSQQQQRGTQILAPQTETFSQPLLGAAGASGDASDLHSVPRSPFLPRKRLRSSSQIDCSQPAFSGGSSPFFSSPALMAVPGAASGSQQQQPHHHHPAHAGDAPHHPHYPVSSMELLGGSQSNVSEPPSSFAAHTAVPSSLTPPPPQPSSQTTPTALTQAELRAWEDARQSENLFYQYVTNSDRSRFINMLASITQRNMDDNRRARLIGIENEKKREQRMGFEEGGLAAVRTEEEVGAAGAAQADADEDGREAEAEQKPAELTEEEKAEQALVAFDAKAASELTFESVPDDFFAVEADAPHAPISPTNPSTRARQRRAGANPNRLVVGEAERQDPALVRSQLVHRSATGMAQSFSQSASQS